MSEWQPARLRRVHPRTAADKARNNWDVVPPLPNGALIHVAEVDPNKQRLSMCPPDGRLFRIKETGRLICEHEILTD